MTETIRIDDLTVRYAPPAQPTREPVLFVHGYFASATVFEQWLPLFAARGFPSYAVNLRGRAGSRPGADLGSASIADFVEDAAAVARHLGTPTVVGHSMGGLIAQVLAARGDSRATVLLTPAPPRGITVLSPRVVIKQLKYLPAILRSRVVAPDHDDLREIVLNRIPASQQESVLDQLSPDSGRAARDMSITGVPVDARRVRRPVLVVVADDDRFIPKAIGARVAKRYGAPLWTIPGHAHMLVIEPGWETIADAVAAWIASV
jgi:pimeloyl-ACP methyl ester carboxylesterase